MPSRKPHVIRAEVKMNDIWKQVEDWALQKELPKEDDNLLIEVQSIIMEAMITKDYKALNKIHHHLTPISNAAMRHLKNVKEPKWIIDAARLLTLTGMVRGSMFYLEKIDIETGLDLIDEGQTLLGIILDLWENTLHKEFEMEIPLMTILEHWPDVPICRIPTKSKIAWILSSLDSSGFIQLLGVTEDRHYRVLDKSFEVIRGD